LHFELLIFHVFLLSFCVESSEELYLISLGSRFMPTAGFCRILFYIFDIINIFELHNYLQALEIVVPLPFFDSSGDDRALLHDQFMKRPPFHNLQIFCSELSRIQGGPWEMGCLFRLDKETGLI